VEYAVGIMQCMAEDEGKREWVSWHQFGGHGETGAGGMEVDGGIFKADPFCNIATLAEIAGNDDRGDVCDIKSFEGDTLRDDGPLIM